MSLQTIVSTFIAPAIAASWSADTIHVDDDARDDPGPGDPLVSDPLEDGSVAHPFDSIQEAIDASADGDTVLLGAGTYTGDGNRDVDFNGLAITVRGESGAEKTIVDCQATDSDPHRGFIFQSGETPSSRLAAVTVTNGLVGDPGQGGAVWISGSPMIVGCRFVDNTALGDIPFTDDDASGGALYAVGSPQIIDCEFIDNGAPAGTGGVGRGGAIYADGDPLIDGCTIRGNGTSGLNSASGGGLYIAATATITDTIIDDNTAASNCSASGGGIRSEGAVTMQRCRITGNKASGGGGCAGSGNGLGAGAVVSGLLEDCVISDNTATGSSSGSGGGLVLIDDATVVRCAITGNSATQGFGTSGSSAGVSGSNVGTHLLLNCLIARNKSPNGAGVSGAANMTLVGCTVCNNLRPDILYVDPPVSGTALGGPMTAINCVIWGNDEPAFGGISGDPTVSRSTTQGGFPGAGNVATDPLFLSASAGRFELLPTSTAIDAADNTAFPVGVTTDLDGHPRFVDDPDTVDTGVGTPPLADMGALEKQGPPCVGDVNRDGTVDVDDLVKVITEWSVCCPGDMDFNMQRGDDDADLLLARIDTVCPSPAPCPGDLNGDGLVTMDDFFEYIDVQYTICPFCESDVSNSLVVDVDDLVQVIMDWGDCE